MSIKLRVLSRSVQKINLHWHYPEKAWSEMISALWIPVTIPFGHYCDEAYGAIRVSQPLEILGILWGSSATWGLRTSETKYTAVWEQNFNGSVSQETELDWVQTEPKWDQLPSIIWVVRYGRRGTTGVKVFSLNNMRLAKYSTVHTVCLLRWKLCWHRVFKSGYVLCCDTIYIMYMCVCIYKVCKMHKNAYNLYKMQI